MARTRISIPRRRGFVSGAYAPTRKPVRTLKDALDDFEEVVLKKQRFRARNAHRIHMRIMGEAHELEPAPKIPAVPVVERDGQLQWLL